MDISLLAHSVTTYLAPFMPYLIKAGEGAAGEAGKKLVGEAWDGAKTLWAKLWPKVEAKPAALEAAEDLAKAPDNLSYQTVLQVQLMKILEADQALQAEVVRIIEEAQQSGVNITITALGERSVAAQNINAPVLTGDVKRGE